LSDFFDSTAPLLSGSASHWGWYKSLVWTDAHLAVTTLDGRVFTFEGTTGALLR
jgi:hypothetical protein